MRLKSNSVSIGFDKATASKIISGKCSQTELELIQVGNNSVVNGTLRNDTLTPHVFLWA